MGLGRFCWVLNSPQYHRLHHSPSPEHFNCNFAAQLPIFADGRLAPLACFASVVIAQVINITISVVLPGAPPATLAL